MIYNFNTNALAWINAPSPTVSFVKYMYSYISTNIWSQKFWEKRTKLVFPKEQNIKILSPAECQKTKESKDKISVTPATLLGSKTQGMASSENWAIFSQ